ncbi:hypothetical protein D3C79_826200 [compost metagenome]
MAGQLYVVGEQGMILRLSNTDQRLHAVSVDYPGTLFGLAQVQGALLVYGLRGTAFRSEDQGGSWTPVATGSQVSLVAALMGPEGGLQLLSQAGQRLVSTDGGRSFTPSAGPLQATSDGVLLASGKVLKVGPQGVIVPPPMP